tara:strand:+ start:1482 stop:1724 length:243 start_codon:yes stop_codon:yes gene_type:complete
MPKLKKEELKKLRELVSSTREKKVALADIDISIRSLEASKSKMHAEISQAEKLFKEYSATLEESIGNVSIDLNTGEYRPE